MNLAPTRCLPLKQQGFWRLAGLCSPSAVTFPGRGGAGSTGVSQGAPCNPCPKTHLEGDEQRVQSSGLLRGGHGLAAGLQLADGDPADALEGLVGLHLLQGDDEDVALFVFDRLKEDLPQVLDAQQPLCDRVGRWEKAEGQGTSWRHCGSGQLGCACSCLLETSLPRKAP